MTTLAVKAEVVVSAAEEEAAAEASDGISFPSSPPPPTAFALYRGLPLLFDWHHSSRSIFGDFSVK